LFIGHCYVDAKEYKTKKEQRWIKEDTENFRVYRNHKYRNKFTGEIYKRLAGRLGVKVDDLEEKAGLMLVRSALREVEAELYLLMARYDVKSIDELDKRVRIGKITEEELGEDFFRMDYLLEKDNV
jgi:hypothetical protein